MLAIWARYGNLKASRLSIEAGSFVHMMNIFGDPDTTRDIADYNEFLEVLMETSKHCKFQKCITVSMGKSDRKWPISEDDLIKDTALTWDGKMICNEKLEWEDGQYVGEFSRGGSESPSAVTGEV